MTILKEINKNLEEWGLDLLEEMPYNDYETFSKFADNCALDFVIKNNIIKNPKELDWSGLSEMMNHRDLRDSLINACMECDDCVNVYELLSNKDNNKVIERICGQSRKTMRIYWNILTENEKLVVLLATEIVIDVLNYKMDAVDLPYVFAKWKYLVGASIKEDQGKFRFSLERVRVSMDNLRDIKR